MAEHDDGTAAMVLQKIGGETPDKKTDHEETAREIIGGEEVLGKTDRDSLVSGKLINKVRDSSSSSSDSEDDRSKTSLKTKFFRRFGGENPVHKVIRGAADVFLWKNKKTSFWALYGVSILFGRFEVYPCPSIPLICHTLVQIMGVVFVLRNGFAYVGIPPPSLFYWHASIVLPHIPEEPLLPIVSALMGEINRGLGILRDIASARDVKKFLSVVAGLWVLSVLGSYFSLVFLVYSGVVVLFTVPWFYDKYEDQVNALGVKVIKEMKKVIKEMKKQYAVFDAKLLIKMLKGLKKEKQH